MSEPIATTTQGRVRGTTEDGLQVFRGIPFAQAPVGPLRWQKPQSHARWDGVRDALHYGATAPQLQMVPPGHPLDGGFPPEPTDEDCLFLNVWTPGLDDARRPVLVWIHGGGFAFGSGSNVLSQLHTFARHDVVGVSINYRLGVLGFLHLDEVFDGFENSGNCGMLDQAFALEWVRDNIAAFGGDPDRVTIAGESAGGMSVGNLMGMPRARGLFHQAIPQSGAGHHIVAPETATRISTALMGQLGVKPGDRAALDALKPQQLLEGSLGLQMQNATPEAHRALMGDDAIRGMLHLGVIDGDVYTELPIDAVRRGNAANVTTMVGTCRDENRLFTHVDGVPAGVPDIEHWFAQSPHSSADVQKAYGELTPGATAKDIDSDIATDSMFGVPCVRLADAQSQHADVYRYMVCHESNDVLRACHAIDIPLAFDRTDLNVLVGPGAKPLASQMHEAWTQFVKTGKPSAAGLPDWPAYDASRRPTMCFELGDSAVVDDPNGARVRLWEHW